ncbi:hypothetical protein QM452_01715 [Streptococcus australis]|uniref:hypothetical protein n=1 Tax=Streptococcus australis TaxID=113107 RepID=UPI0039C3A04A
MNSIINVIKAIGRDIKALTSKQAEFLKESKVHGIIDEKLKNNGNPFVTRSEIPAVDTTQLASKNDLEELKRKVGTSGNTTTELKGQGFPYALDAEIGVTYIDTTARNGAFKWIKKRAGAGRDNWVILAGDTGRVRAKNVQSVLGASFMEFRRINSTVEINFGGLSWGWFGIKRRGAVGYMAQGSDRERNVVILNVQGIPVGFRPSGSKLGMITNDKGQRLGTWYLGGQSDGNQFRLQFDDPVPTDRDIGDIRFSSVVYITDDPWPETL